MAKTDEQIALDRICEASGYQRWWISSGRLHFERDKAPDRIEVLPIISVAQPEAPFTSDREQAALWRDLVLLDPMDLMVIYGGAENDVVLLGKLKEFIEAKRKEQATPQSERE